MENKRPLILAVDFDGTLENCGYPEIGEIELDIVEKVKLLKSLGAVIILNTCREGDLLYDAVDWCECNGLSFNYINDNAQCMLDLGWTNCRKVFADFYLDDKAFNLEYFKQSFDLFKKLALSGVVDNKNKNN